jgi:predicted DNA-binding transcriptional regulator AlpA
MNLEEHIRKIVAEELDKRQQAQELVSITEFCQANKIHRNTIWRHEKEGRLKLIRIGRKVFINPQQFSALKP